MTLLSLSSVSSLALGLAAVAHVARRSGPAPRLETVGGVLIVGGLGLLGAGLPLFRW